MSTQKTCEKYGHYCQICGRSIDVSELEAELQRYKDVIEAWKRVVTRLGGCDCDNCLELELADIQAAKENGK